MAARAYRSMPPGLEALNALKGRRMNYNHYKALALVLTFLSYMAYHAARKPPSIVKSVLKGDKFNPGMKNGVVLTGWAPFNGENGQSLLGEIDLAFLGTYAVAMFFAGHIGDRVDLRLFLSIGMLGSGVFTALFGVGYFAHSHSLSYYLLVSVAAGLFQSTGWPTVVSVMANWFGKGKRGLIMGIWNAHTSIGNILGTFVAAACLQHGWGWSFVVPGLLMVAVGVLVFFFLAAQPSDVGLHPGPDTAKLPKASPSAADAETQRLLGAAGGGDGSDDDKAVGGSREAEGVHFMDAWRIPGVASYALCLFFCKLIAYTFLYWLPYYIRSTPIEGRYLSAKQAGDLSVLFDVGGVAGGIVAGHMSDKSGASACVAVSFTLLSVPFLYMYRTYGHLSSSANIGIMMATGFFVNGPYALITTAVSADLGTHESMQGNAKALATVTAIIDGMGSLGAALGPLMTGYISDHAGFDMVFAMLYAAAMIAGLLLFKLAAKEVHAARASRAPSGGRMVALSIIDPRSS